MNLDLSYSEVVKDRSEHKLIFVHFCHDGRSAQKFKVCLDLSELAQLLMKIWLKSRTERNLNNSYAFLNRDVRQIWAKRQF